VRYHSGSRMHFILHLGERAFLAMAGERLGFCGLRVENACFGSEERGAGWSGMVGAEREARGGMVGREGVIY
jgi:hypothetical protein